MWMKFGCQQFCSKYQPVETVVHSKNSPFDQKLQKKLFHFNKCELGFRSEM